VSGSTLSHGGASGRTWRRRLVPDVGFSEWLQRNAPIIAPTAALLLLTTLFAILAPDTFLSPGNFRNILSQTAVLAFLATGVTFVLLVGEIDLSVANVAVLAGMLPSLMFIGHPISVPFGPLIIPGNQWVAMASAILLCGSLGALTGLLVSRLGVPSFIATLGVMLLADGLSYYWAQGLRVYDLMPAVTALGSGFIGPFPNIFLSATAVLVLAHIVLSRTRFGRYVYMTGSNRTAAQLAGISTRRVLLQVFIVAAVLSAMGGMINVGRMGSADARSGVELLMPAIAAVVLGGTSVFGGIGGIPNTVVGLLLYGVLNNGLDQMQMDIYLKPFARGGFLIIAIVFNIVALNLAARSRARAAEAPSPPATPAVPESSADGAQPTPAGPSG
jgi:ribose transport system permease protein